MRTIDLKKGDFTVSCEPGLLTATVRRSDIVIAYDRMARCGGMIHLGGSRTWREKLRDFLRDMKQAQCNPRQTVLKILGNQGEVFRQQLLEELKSFGLKVHKKVDLDPEQEFLVRFNTSVFNLEYRSTGSSPRRGAASEDIRVLIFDTEKEVLGLIHKALEAGGGFQVLGMSADPQEMTGYLRHFTPDIILVGSQFLVGDGGKILRQQLRERSIPLVLISSDTELSTGFTSLVMDLGVVDFVERPTSSSFPQVSHSIREISRTAGTGKSSTQKIPGRQEGQWQPDQGVIVAIGSSTGGTSALEDLLTALPANIPPMVVVQHIPEHFSQMLAKRLNAMCPFEVIEGRHDERVIPGRVIIAPGGMQMRLKKTGSRTHVRITDEAPVNRHAPSVDVLFHSIAKQQELRSIGMILTGMGRDGAQGLLNMHQNGSITLAQDEQSCVVFGMPREAIRIGAVHHVVSLQKMPEKLLQLLQTKDKKTG